MRVLVCFTVLVSIAFVGIAGYSVGTRLNEQVIAMAVGVFFGVMAGVPMSIMVLASRRQADYHERHRRKEYREAERLLPARDRQQPKRIATDHSNHSY